MINSRRCFHKAPFGRDVFTVSNSFLSEEDEGVHFLSFLEASGRMMEDPGNYRVSAVSMARRQIWYGYTFCDFLFWG